MLVLAGCKAQQPQRSQVIETIEGKKYYIHKIEKKQSLYGISKLYNIPVDELYRANPELLEGAKAGQEIRIPYVEIQVQQPVPNAIDSSRFITHRAGKGETIYSITKRFNISERELYAMNPGLATTGLKEGQLLVVGEKKKRAAKENRENKPVVTVSEKPVQAPVDSSLFMPMHKASKRTYNVALILPFRLDQAKDLDPSQLAKTNTDFPNLPALSVDFYLGFKAAADSLATDSFKTVIRLYDIDEKDTTNLNKIVNEPAFSSTDIVFGPLHASGFKNVAKRAAELRVPMVSPITQQNKILFNNIYVSKTNPSQFTLMESLADYCADSLLPRGANFILAISERGDRKESVYTGAFRMYYNEKLKQRGRPQDSIRIARGIEAVKLLYKPDVKNVVVMLSASQVFVADFSTQLAIFADKKDIMLCGWQSVTEMDNIDLEYLNQLTFTFPHQFNTTNLGAYHALSNSYRSKQETSPSDYFYIGYDVATYYLKHLRDAGPNFIYQLDKRPMETRFMRFRFARPDLSTGFDNRGVYIMRFSNYELRKTGW
jgi:LysM repeat protein